MQTWSPFAQLARTRGSPVRSAPATRPVSEPERRNVRTNRLAEPVSRLLAVLSRLKGRPDHRCGASTDTEAGVPWRSVRYMVGAEHVEAVQRPALVPGLGLGEPRIVPRGITHAIELATGEVACGRPSDGLVAFPDLDWERAAFLVACKRCREVVLE